MNRIRDLRKGNHLSQEDLAEALNVSQTAVSHWETGKNYPDIRQTIELAFYFDVSTDYLLGVVEDGDWIGSAHKKRVPNVGEILARNLWWCRKQRGLTIAQLSQLTGLPVAHLTDLEQGKRMVGVNTLVQIADTLQIPMDNLLREDGAPNREEAVIPGRSLSYIQIANRDGTYRVIDVPPDMVPRLQKLIEAGLPELLEPVAK